MGRLLTVNAGSSSVRLAVFESGGRRGMLFANRCTWAHALAAAAEALGLAPATWLTDREARAVQGQGDPEAILKG